MEDFIGDIEEEEQQQRRKSLFAEIMLRIQKRLKRKHMISENC